MKQRYINNNLWISSWFYIEKDKAQIRLYESLCIMLLADMINLW